MRIITKFKPGQIVKCNIEGCEETVGINRVQGSFLIGNRSTILKYGYIVEMPSGRTFSKEEEDLVLVGALTLFNSLAR